MRSEKVGISILSVSAVVLFLACVFMSKPAGAEVSVKDRDYMMATYPSNNASDAIYIADTRNGLFAVFVWDNTTRSLQPIAVRPLSDAFGGKR
ncbi:MAG TPA: hypothetical protein VGQ99_15195 [Tepidisphaeraceae bacterium]|jgi:hypothetical protein|nr:hypothetical protein [Tepidisphaeraceae bacterium]